MKILLCKKTWYHKVKNILMLINNGANPGQQLRNFIKELFPKNCESEKSSHLEFFITRIDEGLMANGEFVNVVYESSINYMLRRLINTAEYLKRKYETDDFPPEKFIEELRRFLKDNIRIPEENSEKLLVLIQACLIAKDKQVKSSRRRRLIKEHKSKNELKCYVCGKELNEEEVEIEHLWPKTMGGATEDFNLKISCRFCNNKKQQYIDASDFHYEQICLVSDKNDETFANEMRKEYKIALWAKNNYSCSICRKPASVVGKLNFGRINQDDSWHFLNKEFWEAEWSIRPQDSANVRKQIKEDLSTLVDNSRLRRPWKQDLRLPLTNEESNTDFTE